MAISSLWWNSLYLLLLEERNGTLYLCRSFPTSCLRSSPFRMSFTVLSASSTWWRYVSSGDWNSNIRRRSGASVWICWKTEKKIKMHEGKVFHSLFHFFHIYFNHKLWEKWKKNFRETIATSMVQCKPDISRLVGSKHWYRDISGSAIYRASVMSHNQAPFSSALWARMGP